MRWRDLRCLLAAVAPLVASAQPVLFDPPLSPRIANYAIEVRLDPDSRLLHGREVLTWTNTSEDEIDELQFHLYLNAFRNHRSTFVEESGGKLRDDKMGDDEKGWGFIEIDRIALADPETSTDQALPPSPPSPAEGDQPHVTRISPRHPVDVTGAMEFISPDDGNEHDKTVFRLPLPTPLAAGERVKVEIDFTALLPSPPFARTGAKEEYFMVGQWFPKVAVYQHGGWNCHQFHAHSEFFADYGVYDVQITLPAKFVVGATGTETDVATNDDGTRTHTYHAEDVHDFAWTASPEYLDIRGTSQDVEIRVLLQPDHAHQAERHLEAAKRSVAWFQDTFGDYPYPNLTVVDPRRGAGGSGGMEYPTLITAGTSYGLLTGARFLEHVIHHEFGHNYWYHLLASNEFEESWLDEGVNTYTDIWGMGELYGDADMLEIGPVRMSSGTAMRAFMRSGPNSDPIRRTSWEYYNSGSYGVSSYAKPGVLLTTLHHYLGDDVMRRAMRAYVERFRFHHPTSSDFEAVISEIAGQDLSWFFDQALRSNAVLDYAVTSVSSTERKDEGYDFDLDVAAAVAEAPEVASDPATDDAEESLVEDAASAAPEEDEDEGEDEDEAKTWVNEVKVRRMGEFRFPVTLEVVFEDGETIRESWDGQELWHRWQWVRPVKIAHATVDPEDQIPLDLDRLNNSRTRESRYPGPLKAATRLLFWLQAALDLLSL